jgi:sirohydrochlorin ferrochelatase
LDQKPIVIGLAPLVSGAEKERGWTLLVTPYLVRRDDDLRRLFECRMTNRSRPVR